MEIFVRSTSRRTRTAIILGTSLIGIGALQGTAAADLAKDKAQTVDLPYGEKLILPYEKLPEVTTVDGVPASGTGTEWDVDLDDGKKVLQGESVYEGKVPLVITGDALTGRGAEGVSIYHKNGKSGSIYYTMHGETLGGSYCSGKDKKNCSFKGLLTTVAPTMSQTATVPGGIKVTLNSSVTETETHAKTEGWSVGATVKGTLGWKGGAPEKSAELGGSFTYSKSSTDTNSKATTEGVSYGFETEKGKWTYGEMRFAGGQYTGFLKVVFPKGTLKGSHPIATMGLLKSAEKYKFKVAKNGGTWSNAEDVIEYFPMKAGVKAPGNLPATTLNHVSFTNHNVAAMPVIKKLQGQISEAQSNYTNASEGERKEQKKKLDELNARMSKMLRDSNVKVESKPAEFAK
ncbi:hypothetical protein [Streptomyces sp. NPDC001404]|uniref:hypothetical protein n=1 Tax=Streptomyces sp. NPDC001404 TaxID=3364571 RepID=UPI00367A15D7